MFCSLCEKLMLNMANVFQEFSNKSSYASKGVSEWAKSKAYPHVQGGGGIGQKCDGFVRTYFMDDSLQNVICL